MNSNSADNTFPTTTHDGLVVAAKKHISFLEAMHKLGITLRSPSEKSFHRYVDYWLPLVHSATADDAFSSLIPPDDVAWLWHCHRLAPLEYEKYVTKEFGSLQKMDEATTPFLFQTTTSYGRDEFITQSLWKQRYPDQPFFLQEDEQQQGEQAPNTMIQKCQERLCGFNVFASAQAQRTFLWQISEPWYTEDTFLKDGVDRYHKFLRLARVMDRSIPLVPTFQIDLLWHTHILLSVTNYNIDCQEICGRPFSHDDSFNDRSEGGSLEQAFDKTCELWKQQYGTNYWLQGAMYRGEPPEEYYTEYSTFDGSEWTIEYPSPFMEWFRNSVANAKERLSSMRPRGRPRFFRRNKTKNNSTPATISWTGLLNATGTDLWALRKQAYGVQTATANEGRCLPEGKCLHVPVNSGNNGTEQPRLLASRIRRRRAQGKKGDSEDSDHVTVLGDYALFQDMETNGLEKKELPSTTPKSLTQEVGEEWVRQRELIAKRALARVKEMSIQAVDTVSWEAILQREAGRQRQSATNIVDLKSAVVEACLEWLMHLFAGCSYDARTSTKGDYNLLAKTFLDLWNEIRARHKNSATLQAAQEELIQAIQTVAGGDEKGGLIHHIFQQPTLTTEQAAMNCVNAMVAAYDATVVVVFWTLWNLAKQEGAWTKCRNELVATNDDELDQLAAFKKAATGGNSYDCSQLSYLSRAMAETLRVFPPVWTLPRFDKENNCFVQLDVPWTNGALNGPSDWNPDQASWEGNILATFGAGKRHCPGGTAALFAARRLLRQFVETLETAPMECKPDHALASIYLGPTLCVEGPQYFELQPWENKQKKEEKTPAL